MDFQKEEKTYLIVGIDESNHASELDNRVGIVAATFSRDINDGLYLAYSNKKDDEKRALLNNWMQQNSRDYRFLTLENKEVRKFQPIAAVVTEPLIKSYIGCLKASNREIPSNLRLFVDGILSAKNRAYFEAAFAEDFESVIVRNLIKRDRIRAIRRKGRERLGPKAIEIADILSYELANNRDYNQRYISPEQLKEHQKRVVLDEYQILEAIAREKAKRIKL